jgi:hypothetical protein
VRTWRLRTRTRTRHSAEGLPSPPSDSRATVRAPQCAPAAPTARGLRCDSPGARPAGAAGRQIAVGLASGAVRVYELSHLSKARPRFVACAGLKGQVVAIDWDDRARAVRCNDDANDLKMFDATSGDELGAALAALGAKAGASQDAASLFLEGRWATVSCPRSWPLHGLFLQDMDAADALAAACSRSGGLLAIGDRRGALSLVAFPCLRPGAPRSAHGGHAGSVAFVAFAPGDAALLSASDGNHSLFQWRYDPAAPPLPPALPAPAAQPDAPAPAPAPPQPPASDLSQLAPLLDRGAFAPRPRGFEARRRVAAARARPAGRAPGMPALGAGDDVFEASAQWWGQALPPRDDAALARGGGPCAHALALEHVYGYSGAHGVGNVKSLASGELVYPAGRVLVLSTPAPEGQAGSSPDRQRFVRGHKGLITAVAVHPGGRIVATGEAGCAGGGGDAGGEAGALPLVCVWDTQGPDFVDGSLSVPLLSIRGEHEGAVSALSFSSGGEWLLSVSEDARHSFCLHQWAPAAPGAECARVVQPTGPARVLSAMLNPYLETGAAGAAGAALEVVSCAVDGLTFWDVAVAAAADAPAARREPCVVGDEFVEWALLQEGSEHETRQAAWRRGEALLARPVVSACFLDAHTLAVGSGAPPPPTFLY